MKIKIIVCILVSFFYITSFAQEAQSCSEYYDNGQVRVEGQHLDKKRHGNWKEFYENGNLKSTGLYNKGSKVGEWKNYYETGELSRVYSFNDDGNTTGLSESYFKNGEIESKTEKVSKNLFITKGYFEGNGELFYEYTSVMQPKHFLSKEGYYKEYFKNGVLKDECNYLSGILEGKAVRYYESGEKEWEAYYTLGFKSGNYKQFHKNGKVKLQGSIKESQKTGKEKRYNESGNLIWEGSYSKDKFHGKWILFDELTGKKNNTLRFSNGELKKGDSNINLMPTIIPEWYFERVPIYPGCEKELSNERQKKCMSDKITKFVVKNFNTDIASDLYLNGLYKIKVLFSVNKKGEVVKVQSRAAHPVLEKEAIRVIYSLPNMIPGEIRGKPVTIPYSLPIMFQIQGKKPKKKK